MIQAFVDKYIANKEKQIEQYQTKAPNSYEDIFKDVITSIADPDSFNTVDSEHITVIRKGDYSGANLFIVTDNNYYYNYWATLVYYGSCSGCDSFEAIRRYSDEPVTKEQATEFWTLGLHMVQNMKQIWGED